MSEKIEAVLGFWLGDDVAAGSWKSKRKMWFSGGDELDGKIRDTFGELHGQACAGELDSWCDSARGRLALVILLDQFSRNLGRNSPAAFANDRAAQKLMIDGVACGHDQELHPVERVFLYMPSMHSEELATQERGLELFAALSSDDPECQSYFDTSLDYAKQHHELIAKFGRFPHRNPILDRTATPDEHHYLAGGGATFGQKG